MKRIVMTLNARFDHFVTQLENHEASADGAIREVEDASARARIHMKKVRADLSRLRARITERRNDEEMWTARAVKVHPVDEQRSLECVRRLNLAKRDVLDLEREEEEAARLETELAADLDRVEARLASLRRRRNSLAVRDARAEALATVEGSMPGTMVAEVDGIFERWETQVTRTEIRAGLDDPAGDRVAAAFDREEDEEALRKQLAALIHPEA